MFYRQAGIRQGRVVRFHWTTVLIQQYLIPAVSHILSMYPTISRVFSVGTVSLLEEINNAVLFLDISFSAFCVCRLFVSLCPFQPFRNDRCQFMWRRWTSRTTRHVLEPKHPLVHEPSRANWRQRRFTKKKTWFASCTTSLFRAGGYVGREAREGDSARGTKRSCICIYTWDDYGLQYSFDSEIYVSVERSNS